MNILYLFKIQQYLQDKYRTIKALTSSTIENQSIAEFKLYSVVKA